jgi:hypothetical protein
LRFRSLLAFLPLQSAALDYLLFVRHVGFDQLGLKLPLLEEFPIASRGFDLQWERWILEEAFELWLV